MSTNRKIGLVVIIGLITLGFGIGGTVYMDRQLEKKRELELANIFESEKRAVIAIKNTFSEIQSIEFLKTNYNDTTDSYNMIVKMTDIKGNDVKFSIGFMDKDLDLQDYGIENRDIQKIGKTKTSVQVVYSNGIKGDI